MKCFRCGKAAEIELKYSKRFLCSGCFSEYFEKRFRKTIRVNRLLEPRDITAVALSGGKDSAVTLYILHKLHRKAPKSKLFAISVEQGMGEYQEKSLDASKKLCQSLGIEHHVFSFEKEFGVTMDEVVERIKKLKNAASPCTYCGVLRRKLLNDKARELGATKIATGHNLDDEAQTALMNFVRGELDRIARMGPEVGVLRDPCFVPRIKPLRDSPEEEVLAYASIKKLSFEPSRCPYSGEAFRKTMRKAVDLMESSHAGSKFQILRSTDRLIPMIRSSLPAGEISRCTICGDLTSGDLCRTCQIKKELGIK